MAGSERDAAGNLSGIDYDPDTPRGNVQQRDRAVASIPNSVRDFARRSEAAISPVCSAPGKDEPSAASRRPRQHLNVPPCGAKRALRAALQAIRSRPLQATLLALSLGL